MVYPSSFRQDGLIRTNEHAATPYANSTWSDGKAISTLLMAESALFTFILGDFDSWPAGVLSFGKIIGSTAVPRCWPTENSNRGADSARKRPGCERGR